MSLSYQTMLLLKDAGYPFGAKYSLEGLFEHLGSNLGMLSHLRKEWVAWQNVPPKGIVKGGKPPDLLNGIGDTPEEALAQLYLALAGQSSPIAWGKSDL